MSAAALAILVALAAATPPAPSRWVEDHAGFLSPSTVATLDDRLADYELATGHQVIVWIGKTLDGAPLDDWAVRTFAAWKVGRKGYDDGVILFILAEDRAIDIEVGYGLEDKLPDAIASRIIREVMTPRLQAGDRDGAVMAGTDAILAAIEGKPWIGTVASERPVEEVPVWMWIIGGILGISFLMFAIKHPRQAFGLLWWILATRGGRGLGGGGRSLGGGGGFGGGGGRSGGGGARGHW